ncbi:MAG: tetratricopeptide repeat protein, partial [Flavisolibacter sp.]
MLKIVLRHLLLPAFCFLLIKSSAQQNPAVVDSFKLKLAKATTPEEKVDILSKLSMTLMNTNIAEADKYGEIMSREAEISRKRNLIVKALLSNGLRYSVFTGNKSFLQKALTYYTQALEISKKNKLEKETAETLLSIATVYMSIPDLEKSMSYTTQASAIVSQLNNDSLTVATFYSYGAIYQLKKERILALKNYLMALRKAEEINNSLLKRSCYTILSQFYSDIKEYDKAIDYATKSSEQLALAKIENAEYTAVVDLYLLGDLYMKKKDFSTAMYYYDSSIKKADEINFQPLKMPGYRGILSQFLQSKQPEKALEYLNQRTDLKSFVTNFGAGHAIDNSYAIIYKQLGKYDSAGYYFQKAAPGYENTSTTPGKLSFYFSYADFFYESGNSAKAIEYYNKAIALADQTKDLEWQQRIAKELDTVYAKQQDFEKSRSYSNMYHDYKDSLQKLSEEKDMMQMELADEEQRQKRIAEEQAAALERKHSVQYMGITIGIALVFLLLVIMGAFKVSETTIRIMGFFAFIFLFEFIIMIADAKIHHFTHGEPLPLLLTKIVLIAILLPLHHWLEHKVVHYLASRRLILPSRKSIWNQLIP